MPRTHEYKKCDTGEHDTQNSDYEKLLRIKINSGNQIWIQISYYDKNTGMKISSTNPTKYINTEMEIINRCLFLNYNLVIAP